jgi:hypothetical protein
MSQRIVHAHAELRRLCRMSAKERKMYIKTCGKDFIHCICECIKNLLKGNVPLNQRHLKSLRQHKQSLRRLALKNASLTARKRILQKGGFLGALLQPLVTGISYLLSNVLSQGFGNGERKADGFSR